MFTFLKPDAVKIVAEKYGAAYLNTDSVPAITAFLKVARKNLKKQNGSGWLRLFKLQNLIRAAREESVSSDQATARVYDLEYQGAKPNYGYANPLLCLEGFEQITRIKAANAPKLLVIDIGAGSNEFLRFCHTTLNIPSEQLHGSDISPASKVLIERDGFKGYVGRIENLKFPTNSFDLAYLSYFIDYDTNQRATFSSAIALVRSGGKIILEGLFPVRPFALLDEDKNTFSYITKGQSAAEDIGLVIEAFKSLGESEQKQVSPESVIKSYRYVSSHYGFHKLPSYFITFSIT